MVETLSRRRKKVEPLAEVEIHRIRARHRVWRGNPVNYMSVLKRLTQHSSFFCGRNGV
jgi:hypothetical protein